MRIVLDTNVLVSGIVFGGAPREALRRCIGGQAQLVLWAALVDELRGVLRQPKFGFADDAVEAISAELVAIANIVSPRVVPHVVVDDPADDVVLACAVEGRAAYVVSGDAHLLDLGQYRGIRVLSPREYLKAGGDIETE